MLCSGAATSFARDTTTPPAVAQTATQDGRAAFEAERAQAYDDFVAALAGELGDDEAAVDAAIRTALTKAIDGRLAAGEIDVERAAAAKAVIQVSDAPLMSGFGGPGGHGGFEGRGGGRGQGSSGFGDERGEKREPRLGDDQATSKLPAVPGASEADDESTSAPMTASDDVISWNRPRRMIPIRGQRVESVALFPTPSEHLRDVLGRVPFPADVTHWRAAGITSIGVSSRGDSAMPLLQRNAIRRRVKVTTLGDDADDDALVAAAQRDPHDFAPLFLRYWDAILRYCTLRLDHSGDAEDAASQVFVDAYASLHRFQDRGAVGSFRSWLFAIAHHEIANRHRYRIRHPASPLQDVEESLDSDALFEQVAVAGDIALVIALVQELPDRPREVVELRLAGLTDREIAEVLGVSGQAVRQAQSRAVAQLRIRIGVGSDTKRNAHV